MILVYPQILTRIHPPPYVSESMRSRVDGQLHLVEGRLGRDGNSTQSPRTAIGRVIVWTNPLACNYLWSPAKWKRKWRKPLNQLLFGSDNQYVSQFPKPISICNSFVPACMVCNKVKMRNRAYRVSDKKEKVDRNDILY
jgi:hypothetical protein